MTRRDLFRSSNFKTSRITRTWTLLVLNAYHLMGRKKTHFISRLLRPQRQYALQYEFLTQISFTAAVLGNKKKKIVKLLRKSATPPEWSRPCEVGVKSSPTGRGW